MYYINCFFVYSIIGYFIETIMSFFMNNGFKSGILYGPWTPVYGIGAVVILFVSNYLFKNLHMNIIIETLIMFLVVAIVLSFFEAVGGVLIEKIFNITYWDYTSHKFNIGKYISLEMALVWGVSSVIFIYIIHPLLRKIILKTPVWLTIFLIILFLFDSFKTFFNKEKL